MKRLDLDDLPPKLAALLTGAEAGEEILLVQAGAVVGRLTAGAAEPARSPTPAPPPEEDIKQVFDDFRAAIEDEF